MATADGRESNLGHGPRTSREEYDRRIVALYSGAPVVPTRAQEAEMRRQELDLTVDHRLGRDFPFDRREALWRVAQRVERRRARLLAWHLIRWVLPGGLERAAARIAGGLIAEYGKVLEPAELEAYLSD